MLEEIYINNFILIDQLRLEFENGLNVLTGETGAGKSIIIDALGLIMGDRLRNDLIKDHAQRAVAQAIFDIGGLSELRLFLLERELIEEEENRIIISRQILPNGRSSVRINDKTVTVGTLKLLSGYLIDMHLQHEHTSILRPEKYLDYVDGFIPDGENLTDHIENLFLQLNGKKQQMEKFVENEEKRLQRIDLLNFQIEEIESAGLQADEEKELLELRTRITNSQRLLEGASQLLEILYSGGQGASAYDLLSTAIDTATSLNEDEYLSSLISPLKEICYSLEDTAAGLSSFRDSLDFHPGLLEEVEERLHIIKKLKSKYGQSIIEVLKHSDKAKKELENIYKGREQKEDLEKQIEILTEEYAAAAADLTERRRKAADILEKKVKEELLQLNMPNLKFAVEVENMAPSRSGVDKIEFMFSPNPGELLRPLSRIASGGEISRFILALKKALAERYAVPVLIFDEIDVGVGGTALNAMALKLRQLADNHQVILVTHSPQVASYAQNHFLIEKHVTENKTSVSVAKLSTEEKTREIARMLDGEQFSDIAIKHATAMLNNAAKVE